MSKVSMLTLDDEYVEVYPEKRSFVIEEMLLIYSFSGSLGKLICLILYLQKDDDDEEAEVLLPDHGLIHCHCDQGVLRGCSDIIVIFDYTYFVTVTNQVFSTHHFNPIQNANNDADCGVFFPSRIIN